MSKEILVDVQEEQVLVAVVEDENLVEVYLERELNKRLVGNIYLGKVENVLPGMQAAFVDIGLEKNAFLFVEDIMINKTLMEEYGQMPQVNICDVLKTGQTVLVQITKEPAGTKGARVTTNITLPGRYTVLMPYVDYVGVSRKIEDESERDRLKNIALNLKPQKMGIILRTVASGAQEKELARDLNTLKEIWTRVSSKIHSSAAPKLVYNDLGLTQRIVRDLLSEDVKKIIVNSMEVKEKIEESISMLVPNNRHRVLYEPGDILDYYSVMHQLDEAFNKKVWLKSGAYIVIDQMEALTSIDVNTGKYIGKDNLQSTVLDTNLQAVVEIVRQLRLRNIGGIIIIDFIDMENPRDRQLVLDSLEKELKKDKTKSSIMGITNLGLVEMTRKKARLGLDSLMLTECPYCQGKGKLLSIETIALSTKKKIHHLAEKTLQSALLIIAHSLVAAQLIGPGGSSLKRLEESTGKTIVIKGEDNLHLEHVEIRTISDKEIEAYLPVKEGDVISLKIEESQTGREYDGIARLNGYVVSIVGGGALVGREVPVRITKAYRTYARGEVTI
ncbi:MAG: Rne/Rng family ribonuclease [Bacillota bacterium]